MSEEASCREPGAPQPPAGGPHAPDVLKGLPEGGVMTQNGPQMDTESGAANRCAYTGLGRRCDGS
jgi:hypothetical protein